MVKINVDKKLKEKLGRKNQLPDGEIQSKNVKVKITTFVDLDIIEELKEQAASEGEKYQSLLNKYLRACVFKEVKQSDLRVLSIANS